MSNRPTVINIVCETDVSWQNGAACRVADPELFYVYTEGTSPRVGRNRREIAAKAYCNRCDVREICLKWAFETNDRWAILGGLTPEEREKIRNRKRRKTTAGVA